MRIKLRKLTICAALMIYIIFLYNIFRKSNLFMLRLIKNDATVAERLNVDFENLYIEKKKNIVQRKNLFLNDSNKLRSTYSITAFLDVTRESPNNFTDMISIHQKVYYKFTNRELSNYFAQERASDQLFKNPLDINIDKELLKTLFPNPVEYRDRVTDQLRLKLKTNTTKIILAYQNYGDIINNYKLNNCNVNKCQIITDTSNLLAVDVVFFAGDVSLRSRENVPKEQVWVYYQLESPLNAPITSPNDLVNWTSTFRQDSVINAPYERFTPYLHVNELPKNPIKNYALQKNRSVAWFVSNCGSKNGRLELANQLANYIKVDIYGACGTFRCPRSDGNCFKKLKSEYKFYLSFENSNCKDYITEKLFWNALENDIVPIVMGAHPNDYKRIAPPHSYIHVDDFASMRELANYLIFLDQNDLYYNQYFLWKTTGSFIDTKFTCRLCAMAHLAPIFPMWYSDLKSWWSPDKNCFKSLKPRSWKEKEEELSYSQQVKYGYQRL